jgi:hypothetical protein
MEPVKMQMLPEPSLASQYSVDDLLLPLLCPAAVDAESLAALTV